MADVPFRPAALGEAVVLDPRDPAVALPGVGNCSKHGRRKRFRQLVSGMPTGRLRARLTSMAGQTGIAIIAVDPAYTSKWGAQHWQKSLTSKNRNTSRHDAASIAIGRRAPGHPIRRRTKPPPHDRSDRAGHRTVQADPRALGREETRPRIPGPRTRPVPPDSGANAGNQNAQHRSGRSAEHRFWQQNSLPLSPQERWWLPVSMTATPSAAPSNRPAGRSGTALSGMVTTTISAPRAASPDRHGRRTGLLGEGRERLGPAGVGDAHVMAEGGEPPVRLPPMMPAPMMPIFMSSPSPSGAEQRLVEPS